MSAPATKPAPSPVMMTPSTSASVSMQLKDPIKLAQSLVVERVERFGTVHGDHDDGPVLLHLCIFQAFRQLLDCFAPWLTSLQNSIQTNLPDPQLPAPAGA